ncbi:putative membrane protein [Candidatus Nanobsidianus stetteri]|uniref:Putative membrane protein n=1 Tax=Nanobsidianus stetteri TaxID=1294122 RepID=R1FUP2_NANST|nr:putative membrane protein [Candidatus Nanobsidianus stetteri]
MITLSIDILEIGNTILSFIMFWIVYSFLFSIPVYLFSKLFLDEYISFPRILAATLVSGFASFYINGIIVYYSNYELYIYGIFLAFIIDLVSYKYIANVSWGAAFVIAIVAILLFAIFVFPFLLIMSGFAMGLKTFSGL